MTRKPIASARRRTDLWPTPNELAHAPELAVLAALDTTLEIALRALVAAHPALADPERPYWTLEESPTGSAANVLLGRAKAMLKALAAYRRAAALRRDPIPDDDRSF